MANVISIGFSLTAALTGGFTGAFQSAAGAARNVASAIRDMEKTPVGQLGASMTRQREKIKGLAGSLKEAKETLARLQSQAQASGNTTKLLATQIRMAEDRVNNLSGALSRQRNILLNTAAQAATNCGSLQNLSRQYEELSRKMERARKVQAAMAANRAQGDALRAQRADLNGRLAGATAAAATVAAPVALSIGFEDQMAKVGAVSKASKEDLAALTAQARQLGRDTSFSASQAAQGMQYLAMAGFKTSQVMAAMPGMLDLAAASGTDLGQTANIASNILSAFELKAEDMGHVGDVLVAAFTSSNTTLESLGETMKYVGPVAKDAGASIEDAVAMAAMLGNVGISGSQAGTASKSIFARLAAPPSEAAKALNALNIKTKDAQGNLRAVPDLLEEITLKTASMGTADRTDVFSTIFGLEPMAGASALAKKAAETIDENGKQIVDSMGRPTTALLKFTDDLKHASDNMDGTGGTASRTAKQMNSTTGGSLRMLKSAWEEVGLSIGDLFLPTIKNAASALSGIANVISGFINRFPLLSKVVALVAGGIIALTAASVGIGLVINFVRSGLNGFRGALLRVSAAHIAATTSTAANAGATGLFGVAARLAGAGAKFFAGGLRSILTATGVGALLVALGFAIKLLIDNWDDVMAAMSKAWAWVKATWSRLGVFFTTLGQNLAAIFGPVWDRICQAAKFAKDLIVGYWSMLADFYTGLWNGICSIASAVWDGICAVFTFAYDLVTGYWSMLIDFYTGLWNGVCAIATGVWNTICGVFTWAYNTATGIWSGIAEFFSGVTGGIGDSFSGVWQDVVGLATWAWENIAAIWNGVCEFFGGIVDGIFGVFTGLFDWLKDKFAWVFSTVDAISSFVGSISGAVSGALNAAFGDGNAPAADNAQKKDKSPSAAQNALNTPKNGSRNMPSTPKYQPVSANAYHAAFEGKKDDAKGGKAAKSGGGGRARSGGGGGGRSQSGAGSGASSGNSGPVTVVTLDSGNEIKTQYFAAGAKSSAPNASRAGAAATVSPSAPSAAGGTALQTSGQPALPRTPAMLAGKKQKSGDDKAGQQGISIDLTQNFELITQDAAAVRKILESVRPEMEALIRRALEKISSDKRRTAYAQ